ncbi:MAG TPA: hypothetical protein VJ866_24795 [Pyrinomonadaceae bacterium]|nr:hypothetical protein [Pyrinomonadaceae bacterium]
MRIPRASLCLPLLLLCAAAVAAQEPQPSQRPLPPPSPTPEEFQTRLETLMTEVGSVIIKGFTNVGSMNGSRGVAYFTAWEVTDARTGRREQGVGVEISDTVTPNRRDLLEERAYIDYDELDPLIRGIDYMMKLDDKVTKLARYEAQYQTRGGLVLVSFNTPSGYVTAISTYGGRRPRFVLRPTGLAEFRNLLESAKDALDAPRTQ